MGIIIAVEGLANVCIEKTLEKLVNELEQRRGKKVDADQRQRDQTFANQLRRESRDERVRGGIALIEQTIRYDKAVERVRDFAYDVIFLTHAFGAFFAARVWREGFSEEVYEYLVGSREKEIGLTLWFETGLSDSRSAATEEGYRKRRNKMGWARIDARLNEERTIERVMHECLALVLREVSNEKEEVSST